MPEPEITCECECHGPHPETVRHGTPCCEHTYQPRAGARAALRETREMLRERFGLDELG